MLILDSACKPERLESGIGVREHSAELIIVDPLNDLAGFGVRN
jgi:hypothetical protein